MKDIAYGELFGEEIDELEQSAAKRPKVTSDALVDNRLRNLQNVFLSSITQQTTPAIAEGAKGRPSGPVEDALYAPLRYDDLAVSGMEDEDLFSGLEESSSKCCSIAANRLYADRLPKISVCERGAMENTDVESTMFFLGNGCTVSLCRFVGSASDTE